MKKTLLAFAAAATGLAFSASAPALQWGADTRITTIANMGANQGSSQQPRLAAYNGIVHMAWIEYPTACGGGFAFALASDIRIAGESARMNAAFIPDDITFHRQYGMTRERLNLAGSQALVMHPGPINRNVEIDDDVADDPERSLILKQVANGVPLRMAVLEHCLEGNAA